MASSEWGSGVFKMLLLEFALGLAQSVLGNAISEMVNGRLKSAREEQLRKSVEAELSRRSQFDDDDIGRIVKHTVKEIFAVAAADPDLEIKGKEIRITPKEEGRPELEEVARRLRALKETVEYRRNQLHEDPTAHSEHIATEFLRPPPNDIDWQAEIQGMQRRIRNRRRARR
ncbi:hypothetical protein [Streptomyces sp. NPDC049915]|uniref:hypothetical protein n=1 Tax=Streptomyces sp. NPDC049915 TaxID=3155510 RepID=UPI0034433766